MTRYNDIIRSSHCEVDGCGDPISSEVSDGTGHAPNGIQHDHTAVECPGGDYCSPVREEPASEGYREGVDRVLEYIASIRSYPKLDAELRWAIEQGII